MCLSNKISVPGGWNFICSHTITHPALAGYDSVPFDAAWGSPLLRILPCCLTEMLGIVFVLVFFIVGWDCCSFSYRF